jgi:hypothetical protein
MGKIVFGNGKEIEYDSSTGQFNFTGGSIVTAGDIKSTHGKLIADDIQRYDNIHGYVTGKINQASSSSSSSSSSYTYNYYGGDRTISGNKISGGRVDSDIRMHTGTVTYRFYCSGFRITYSNGGYTEGINYIGNRGSDPRFKYQETSLSNQTSIDVIRNLSSYKYKFKKEKDFDKFDYGFMADEVENVIPDAVLTQPTTIDIENIECNYTFSNNSLLLENLNDHEFDTNCEFHMLYTKCDFSNVSISEVNETTNTCILDTSHNLNYIGKRDTDPLREYIYAHKENIRIRVDSQEYTTKLVYDKNIDLNQLKIDITNIPITQDMSNVEIYRPSEHYDFEAPVVEKTNNEETGMTNYTLELSEEQLEEIKDKSYDTMIWYAVNVKDGRSLNYNHIFMHYHGAIQYLDKENTELKNEVGTLKTELQQIKQHLGL